VYVTVTVTCAHEAEAGRIADLLLDARLVACVHLSPIESRYAWRGERVVEREVVLSAQTRSDRFDDVLALVEGAHSYEVPAITATELVGGSAAYLRWVGDQVSPAP
jgi:periplasmic divalent cation tolerance protein